MLADFHLFSALIFLVLLIFPIIKEITDQRAKSTGYSKFVTEIETEDGEMHSSDLDWFLVAEHLLKKHRRPINYQKFLFSEHWPE